MFYVINSDTENNGIKLEKKCPKGGLVLDISFCRYCFRNTTITNTAKIARFYYDVVMNNSEYEKNVDNNYYLEKFKIAKENAVKNGAGIVFTKEFLESIYLQSAETIGKKMRGLMLTFVKTEEEKERC